MAFVKCQMAYHLALASVAVLAAVIFNVLSACDELQRRLKSKHSIRLTRQYESSHAASSTLFVDEVGLPTDLLIVVPDAM